MSKRYQVFVSSTYADLRDERQRVIQALMELDCIPAGMELFPAADEEQWEFIKRVIDDCDYYILIIGGRYGSLTSDGISYTEKEYDYALAIGLKVLAFIHKSPDEIPLGKSEIDPESRAKLNGFRERVSKNRLVKYWDSADQLPGLAALSLAKTIKLYPAIGWVRANSVSNDELLQDLNNIRKENQGLRDELAVIKGRESKIEVNSNLAGLDDMVDVQLEYRIKRHQRVAAVDEKRMITASWGEIFASIAPDLLEHPSDDSVNFLLGKMLYKKFIKERGYSVKVVHEYFQTIKIQLIAVNLISVVYTKTTTGGMALFWSLTDLGKKVMFQLRTIKGAP